MTILEKIVHIATFKGRTLKIVYVKLDDEKWYQMKETNGIFGYGYMLKEIKKDENVMSKRY